MDQVVELLLEVRHHPRLLGLGPIIKRCHRQLLNLEGIQTLRKTSRRIKGIHNKDPPMGIGQTANTGDSTRNNGADLGLDLSGSLGTLRLLKEDLLLLLILLRSRCSNGVIICRCQEWDKALLFGRPDQEFSIDLTGNLTLVVLNPLSQR